ncbi:toxin [Pseudomonas gingeri]|uniref:Toxin n=1 Tax=Pseudomonas gingeri TaxID=117681 RepID=A0A7Y8BTF4_9PSED|nr:toxin [Pseudomonas gingeri]NWB87333.1 toxin [Pseudomonas gingeri]
MNALVIELPPFERHRRAYLGDEAFHCFQLALLRNPEAGEVIQGTGGLRKVRCMDMKRQKGKRGGIRVIYYKWPPGFQFWLFTLYDKDQQDDLSPQQKGILKRLLDTEIEARNHHEA